MGGSLVNGLCMFCFHALHPLNIHTLFFYSLVSVFFFFFFFFFFANFMQGKVYVNGNGRQIHYV